jgi:hypothetical protein
MRRLSALLVFVLLAGAAVAEDDNPPAERRYTTELDLDRFPQSKPQEALASVTKTIRTGKIYYLLAQLADPAFVDDRVKEYKRGIKRDAPEEARSLAAFEELVKEVTRYYRDDPMLLKQLQAIASEGRWETRGDLALASLKSQPKRVVVFRKIEGRWFLLNQQEAPEK